MLGGKLNIFAETAKKMEGTIVKRELPVRSITQSVNN